jgi:hypothetical protein
MYPYVDVISIEAYNLITENGKNTSIFDENPLVCVPIKIKDLEDVLFGIPIVMQAHLVEIFDISKGKFDVIEDSIIADLDVDVIADYQNITPILNESFNIIGIDYQYPFKLFIPDNLHVEPKRYEYAYIQLPLTFTTAYLLYKKALIIIDENHDNNCDEIVLVKTTIEE